MFIMENNSEVARILQKIALEYAAAEQGFSGYAQVSRHDFIQAKDHAIHLYREKLIELIEDKDQATELVVKTIWPHL
jgi:hypothetical protein